MAIENGLMDDGRLMTNFGSFRLPRSAQKLAASRELLDCGSLDMSGENSRRFAAWENDQHYKLAEQFKRGVALSIMRLSNAPR